ncbi:MAG: hypothetical protein AAF789_00245 [Bacteroidota bacterium]
MRTFLISLACLCLLFCANAQSAGYKKIMAEKDGQDIEVFLSQLQQYQKANAEYGNVYYQIGKIELDRFSKLDPITERLASRQYVYNAKTNFGLAKNYLDEKDIQKNPGWYDAEKSKNKDSITQVAIQKIESNYENSLKYADLYERLLMHNDSAVSNYLKARETFLAINTSAPNLRQLFLDADDSLKMSVKYIRERFLVCLDHLEEYRKVYQELPHYRKRKVEVVLRTIDHFRMNGITPVNFLADEIYLWDYEDWADRFQDLMKKEVDGLHDEINQAFDFFQKTNDRMLFGDECMQANISNLKFQRIINLITKYDNNSTLIPIFQYFIGQLEYGNQYAYETKCNIAEKMPTEDLLSRKARIYSKMFKAYARTDTLAKEIEANSDNVSSFQWFFDETMSKYAGAAEYSSLQRKQNDSTFRREINNLIGLRNTSLFLTDSIRACVGFVKEDSLLTTIGETDQQFCISKIVVPKSDVKLILGEQEGSQRLLSTTPISEEEEFINWAMDIKGEGGVTYFKILSDSLFVMGGHGAKAWIQLVDLKGKAEKLIKLANGDTIRKVLYNNLTKTFTVVQESSGSITISNVNFVGKTTTSDMISIEGKLLSYFVDGTTGYISSYSSDTDRTQLLLYKKELDDWLEPVLYDLSRELKDPFLIKNDNVLLTLVDAAEWKEGPILYYVFDFMGKIIYEKEL